MKFSHFLLASIFSLCVEVIFCEVENATVSNLEDSLIVSTDLPSLDDIALKSKNHNRTKVLLDPLVLKFATQCETPNHDSGYCVEIKTCPTLLKSIRNPLAKDFLRKSSCGPQNENKHNPKVCCGKYGNFKTAPQPNKVDPFPKKCGSQKLLFKGRIFGGTEAQIGEFPWMARLIHKNKYGYKTYGCGGFLVQSKYVVTAAHCIKTGGSDFRGPLFQIVLGEHNTETEIDCTKSKTKCADPIQIIRVDETIVHPDYDSQSLDHYNDIALIHLKKGAKLSDFVQPICLLRPHHKATLNNLYLSGWGKTETEESSPIKMKVELPSFDFQSCKRKYSQLNINLIPSQICAGGQKNKDSCTGDSGGPLMTTINGTTWVAAGLVSYGLGCGKEGWPGVYTDISSYIPWLQNEIIVRSVQSKNAKIGKQRRKKKDHKTITST